MKKARQTTEDSEGKVRLMLGLCAASVVLFSLYSGGELLALAALLMVLYNSYRIIRYSLPEIQLEKLFLFSIGLYLTQISLFGFILQLLGLNLSVINFLILSLLTAALTHRLTLGSNPARVIYDKTRVILIGGSLLIAFLFYLWPSLPSLISACTFGFDCTLHIEQSATIYSLEHAVPPILEWRWYPVGYHTNVAFLAHALEPDQPAYANLIYPFTAFVSAMMVSILCGMLYDRLKKSLYVVLLLIAMLFTVYPYNALSGFGFWANIFGMYFILLFVWVLSDFVANPDNAKMLVVLISITMASLHAYQLLTALTLIFSFLIATLTLVNIPFGKRLKVAFVFLFSIGVFYGLYTFEGYSRYLIYQNEPLSTYEFFVNKTPEGIGLNKGGTEFTLNGTFFKQKEYGVHVEQVYAPSGLNLPLLLSKGLSLSTFDEYTMEGRSDISGPSGSVLFYDIKRIGLLVIFLMVVGMFFSYKKRDYTLVFLEASILHVYLFYLAYTWERLNSYYYSKIMYFFIYPAILFAFIGLHELIIAASGVKKRLIIYACVMVLLLSLGLGIVNGDKLELLFGQRSDLYQQHGQVWPLLEFNRMSRYWDMSWGLKKKDFGFAVWLKDLGLSSSLPVLEESRDYVSSGRWNAADFPQHDTGLMSEDGIGWTSESGGFGYMIGKNYMELGQGSYTATFTIKVDDNLRGDEQSVYLEAAKDYGASKIAGRIISSEDFAAKNTYQDFELAFEITEPVPDVELRAHYEKSQQLVTIQKVTLRKD